MAHSRRIVTRVEAVSQASTFPEWHFVTLVRGGVERLFLWNLIVKSEQSNLPLPTASLAWILSCLLASGIPARAGQSRLQAANERLRSLGEIFA